MFVIVKDCFNMFRPQIFAIFLIIYVEPLPRK